MTTLDLAVRAERVRTRASAVSPARVALTILLLPLILVGFVVAFAWRGLVWVGSWCWYGIKEGWDLAGPERDGSG